MSETNLREGAQCLNGFSRFRRNEETYVEG